MNDQIYPLVSIYRVNCPPPEDEVILISDDKVEVKIINGEIKLNTSRMKTVFTEEGTASEMRNEKHSLNEDTYLIIENWFVVPWDDIPYSYRVNTEMQNSEIASAVEVTESNLISEKIFEDVVDTEGRNVAMPKSPTKITSRPFTKPGNFSENVRESIENLRGMPDKSEDRFRLSSRWFQKGRDEEGMVDKFISWYISLEVYPSQGSTKVTENVRDFLAEEVLDNKNPSEVKKDLNLGRITGLRSKIVHNGLSQMSEAEPDNPGEFLEIVESIVRVSLKSQLGLDYGGELDKWIE